MRQRTLVFLNANSSSQASAGFGRMRGEGDSVPEEGVILAVLKSINGSSGHWNSGEWGLGNVHWRLGCPNADARQICSADRGEQRQTPRRVSSMRVDFNSNYLIVIN